MLSRIEIANYRGFESYKMEGLSRVNLLVGKNNSGKTALLEGIQFFTSGGDPAVLAEVAERRGEVVLGRSDPTGYVARDIAVDIAHFFHGHSLGTDATFSLKGDNGYAPVSVKTFAQKSPRGESAEGRAGRTESAGFFLRIAGGLEPADQEGRKFRISREGGVNFELPSRVRRPGMVRRGRGPQVRFVGPDSLNSIDLAIMWDEITLTGQEVDVSGAMRLLEENLESVHFLTGMFASGYFPSRGGIVVGMQGQDGRVPLGSMGDGMRRLMALAASLAFTKDGGLFVDEIDTGLHYSVMADMWKLVIAKAIASNTQVFATTHSWDCIEGLSQICQLSPNFMPHVSIQKIDRAIPHSVPFSGESIVRMLKADIDPR
jgi:predicted ATPase